MAGTKTKAARPAPRGDQAIRVDVLIVGAGISGIGAAWRLKRQHPDKSFAVLEAKDTFGGTWTTHTYPGIRSDSDLYTFGYDFKPWVGPPIASAEEILAYMRDVIDEAGLDDRIRYGHRIESAAWSSAEQRWTVQARTKDGGLRVSRPASCGCARAITRTTRATRPNGRAREASAAASCIRRAGPTTSTLPASG